MNEIGMIDDWRKAAFSFGSISVGLSSCKNTTVISKKHPSCHQSFAFSLSCRYDDILVRIIWVTFD